MNIVVNGVERDLDLFAKFIRSKFKNILAYDAVNYNFSKIDDYINTLNIKTINRPLSARSIILASTNLLVITKGHNSFTISVDSNREVPDTIVKYSSILKLINYGNMEIKGSFIFTKAKQFIEKNILNYYNEFEGNR